MLRWSAKDPVDTNVPVDINWATDLGTDTISTSTWDANGATSLVLSGQTNTTTETRVLVSGGTVNQDYQVRNTVVTAAGQTLKKTVSILIKNM